MRNTLFDYTKGLRSLVFFLFSLFVIFACKGIEKEPNLDDEIPEQHKEFELYDAMNYVGKPSDLSMMGLLDIQLIYEGHITKKDTNNQNGIILDLEKVEDYIQIARHSNQKIINTDIEHWYDDKSITPEEIKKRFTELFGMFKKEMPDVRIGNYGIAPSVLCVFRFYNSHKYSEEQALINAWKEQNAKRWIVADLVDYFSPSVYIAEPNIDQWIKDLELTVNEIRAFDSKKKIIVYIWPSYYDKPGSPYFKKNVSPKIWGRMLEAVYENCDGAIIWSSTFDEHGKKIQWNDKEVQEMITVTKKFTKKHKKNLLTAEKYISPPLPTVPSNKKFSMFHSIKYSGTPNLNDFGLSLVKTVPEDEVSNGKDSKNIFIPDSVKIAEIACSIEKKMPGVLVCFTGSSWLIDRNNNNAAMVERYQMVSRIFNKNNNKNKLGFFNIGPASLSITRKSNQIYRESVTSWYLYSARTIKNIYQFSDIVLPTAVISDDKIELWERDFRVMVEEAKRQNKDKPIYAYLWTQYHNSSADIIKFNTFFRMLEVVYSLCDGVIIASNSQNENQDIRWSENYDFFKATNAFIERYKIMDSH